MHRPSLHLKFNLAAKMTVPPTIILRLPSATLQAAAADTDAAVVTEEAVVSGETAGVDAEENAEVDAAGAG